MTAAGWLRRYAAHADPATAAANLVALVVAGNGPFYPLYVGALIGWDRTGVWLTMLASPVFFLVPAISRRHSRAGRAALPMIGIVNTVWCSVLFGCESGELLFQLPCIMLAALLYRDDERGLSLLLMGLAIGAVVLLTEFSFGGRMALTGDAAAALARLNLISAATLTGFISLTLAKTIGGADRAGHSP
jgi:hypothetical protein